MAEITVTSANGKTAYAVGDPVVLTAAAPSGATNYQWKHDGKPVGKAENVHEFTMAADSGGEYVVEAKGSDNTPISGSITLSVATAASAEPQPVYHGRFASLIAGILAALGLVLVVFIGPWRHGGMSDTDWTALEGPLKVAVVLGLPATLFGALVLLVGLWMAIVEWRGRLKDEDPIVKPTPKPDTQTKGPVTGEDVAKVIAAVGSLRGAALAMVIGAVLLLGAAWVAASAAGADPAPSAAPTEAPEPDGTPTPGPT